MPELYPQPLHAHLAMVGRFVLLAEWIADATWLRRAENLPLEFLDFALHGHGEVAWSDEAAPLVANLRASLAALDASPRPLSQILESLRRTTTGLTIHTWDDLSNHCRTAALPLGRHILAICKEDPQICGPAMDQLSMALWVLRRLRDCRNPARPNNHFCVPRQFMEDAAISDFHMRAPSAKGQTRSVIDRMLDGTDRLLRQAAPLPHQLKHRSLRQHTAIALCRARKLSEQLRHRDPLSERVELEPNERRRCRWRVRLDALLGRL